VGGEHDGVVEGLVARGRDDAAIDIRAAEGVGGQAGQRGGRPDGTVEKSGARAVDGQAARRGVAVAVQGRVEGDVAAAANRRVGRKNDGVVVGLVARRKDYSTVDVRRSAGIGR